jgi:hypothetical protein
MTDHVTEEMNRLARIATKAHSVEREFASRFPTCEFYMATHYPTGGPDKRPRLSVKCPTASDAQSVALSLAAIGMEDVGNYGIPESSPAGRRGYSRRVVGYVAGDSF